MGFFNREKKKRSGTLLPDADDGLDLGVDPDLAKDGSPVNDDVDASGEPQQDSGSESVEAKAAAAAEGDVDGQADEEAKEDKDAKAEKKEKAKEKKGKDKDKEKEKEKSEVPPETLSRWTAKAAPLLACTSCRAVVAAEEKALHVWRDVDAAVAVLAMEKDEKVSCLVASKRREVCYIGTQKGALCEVDLTEDTLSVKKKMREGRVGSKSSAAIRLLIPYTPEGSDEESLFILYQDGTLYNVSAIGDVLGVVTVGKLDSAAAAYCAAENVLYIATGASDVIRVDAAETQVTTPLAVNQKVASVCCLAPKIIICGDKGGTLYARDMEKANAAVAKCSTGLPTVDVLQGGGYHVMVCSNKAGIEVVNPRTGVLKKAPREEGVLKTKALATDPAGDVLVYAETAKKGVYKLAMVELREVVGDVPRDSSTRSLHRSRSATSEPGVDRPSPLSHAMLDNASLSSSPAQAARSASNSPSPSPVTNSSKAAWPDMDSMFAQAASTSPPPNRAAPPSQPASSAPTTPAQSRSGSNPSTPAAGVMQPPPPAPTASMPVSLFPPVQVPASPASPGGKRDAQALLTEAFCLLGGTRAVESLAVMQTSLPERARLYELVKELRASVPGV
eukprot:TRINITY_DN19656_c0_g1_i3.p1 TRINITY_DN19656_c0_g1~~TRINITY_DN19656_c0_g1_i3.p1  ORF type:complete len:617 (+),score=198.03 TRINITY_DN19656_c0_g1_i3:42-1892(+)